jgi:hypothetical protein
MGSEKARLLKTLVENIEALNAEREAEGKATAIKIIRNNQDVARMTLDRLQLHLGTDEREHLEGAICDLQAAINWLEDPDSDDDCDWYQLLISVVCATSTVYFPRRRSGIRWRGISSMTNCEPNSVMNRRLSLGSRKPKNRLT